MLKNILNVIMGDRHEREAKRLAPVVAEINAHFERLQGLSEPELQAQTQKFRDLIQERTGALESELEELRQKKRVTEDTGERQSMADQMRVLEDQLKAQLEDVLEEILPEAFATVKEACRRNLGREINVTGHTMTWDMVPYDVQLIGGIALHHGKVAEMATGEGKTLVATMPLYLNALTGRGAHLVTVNTYLAQRDAEWMGTIYRYLGLTVDCTDLYEPNTPERRNAYAADITYGTNNEFGFDYLRDNMVHSLDQRVQRGHNYAIIDEVDSILIDEARTPLIISGPVAQEQSDIYRRYNPMVSDLYRKQARIAGELVAEAEKQLEQAAGMDDKAAAPVRFEAGEKLLAVKRATPRNRRLQKLFADEPSVQRLVQQVEAGYMREKRLHELDELLYFQMDEKGHTVSLSDKGLEVLSPSDPDAFTAPDLSVDIGRIQKDPDLSPDDKRKRIEELEKEFAEKSQKIHAVHQLLKAYALYSKDEQYIVEEGQVVIVDEFTGRKMVGRRWSDGLHQAVEAKEGVTVKGETQTYATITIQNYFRMYTKLAGMTGTAETEEGEFHQIYDLDVMVIPTNRPIVRDDRNDLIYRTRREKYNAIMDEIERLHMLQLPVLVGTVSVDVSETVSRMLKRRGIPHSVLNAKYHQQEAEIVSTAGQPGAVTIATNMAGRGTDIKLGPGVKEARTAGWARQKGIDLSKLPASADPFRQMPEDVGAIADDFVLEEGGLHIVGSERHESRRIDRQLRGRAGRQGDPGASQFLMSLEDDLMRLFGGMDRIAAIMERMGAEEGEVITHGLVTRNIERAQKRVEMQNFEARKRLLDYDDVMNQQREVVYDLRLFALEGGADLVAEVWEMTEAGLTDVVEEFIDETVAPEEWNLAGLRNTLVLDFMLVVDRLPNESGAEHEFDTLEQVEEAVLSRAREAFKRKLDQFGDHRDRVLSWVMLGVIDEKWRDHLYDLDHLKASINFRSWGQKDPLIEYKTEAYDLFVGLMKDLRRSIASIVFRAQLAVERRPAAPAPRTLTLSGPSDTPETAPQAAQPAPQPADQPVNRLMPGAKRVEGDGDGARGRADQPVSGAAMAAMMGAGAPRPGPDPRQLATNRGDAGARQQQPVTKDETVGRNDPCPCGSGKKYKKCHGAAV